MKTNITKNSYINGTITFSKEEKESVQKVYLLFARIYGLMLGLHDRKDNFMGYLNFNNNYTEQIYYLEEILETLKDLKNLKNIEFKYYESQIES